MEKISDSTLLHQISEGNKLAFSLIYKKYWKVLYSTAYSRLKDSDQSQDVVQDIFVSLWDRRTSLSIENLNAYLHTSIRYNVFKLLANKKVHSDFNSLFHNLTPLSLSPDHEMISNELMIEFNKLFESLPKERSRIFKLRYEENLKTKVIAKQLGISQKTVQNQLLSSYKDIRKLLAQILSLLFFLIYWG